MRLHRKTSLTGRLDQQDSVLEGLTDAVPLEPYIPTINISGDASPAEMPHRETRSLDCDMIRPGYFKQDKIGGDLKNESEYTLISLFKKLWGQFRLKGLRRNRPQAPYFSNETLSNRPDNTHVVDIIHSNIPHPFEKSKHKIPFENSSYLETRLGWRGFSSNISLRLFAGSADVAPKTHHEHVQATEFLDLPTPI